MPTTKRLGGEISIPLWKRLRIASIEQDKTLNAMLEQVIEAGLNAVSAPSTATITKSATVAPMDPVTRLRDYGGPCMMVGLNLNVVLWTAVREYCIGRSIPFRHFATDALRRHLRLVKRGAPDPSPEPTRRIRV